MPRLSMPMLFALAAGSVAFATDQNPSMPGLAD
jgi:hypothetical protein